MIRPSGRLTWSFWLGFMFHAILTMFIQDWHGKEWYMRLVDTHWMEIHWAVWIVPMLLVLFAHASNRTYADKKYLPNPEYLED